jgi:hypothetical protein
MRQEVQIISHIHYTFLYCLQLRQWTTSDVIRWLEKKGLHKFILTFQSKYIVHVYQLHRWCNV